MLCEDPPLPGPTRRASPPGSPEPASGKQSRVRVRPGFTFRAEWAEAHLLPEVHGEAHVPDVALAVVKASQDGHVGLVGFDAVHVVLHFPWFPANDGVLTRLIKTRADEGLRAPSTVACGSDGLTLDRIRSPSQRTQST